MYLLYNIKHLSHYFLSSNMERRILHIEELPNEESVVFRDSSYFKNNSGELPTPDVIRQKDIEINDTRTRTSRPYPIPFEERGLVVKYGSEVTIAEAQCLWYFNKHMKDEVPTPELFGWCRDGDETFIYMQLVQGSTLEEAWPSLNNEERVSICEELRRCVGAWRELRQESEPYYIGTKSDTVPLDAAYDVYIRRSHRKAGRGRHYI